MTCILKGVVKLADYLGVIILRFSSEGIIGVNNKISQSIGFEIYLFKQ
jgi:hypothetical protein